MPEINEYHSIVPAHLAVQAMRDNGYKNAAYAVAELIDNAIQAGATQVELLCGEREELVTQRVCRRLQHLAVLDNGSGMDAATLRIALQFGNGTHLLPVGQRGMGKFGMGLPCASISQCRRVEVWTWQNGNQPIYSYLDIDEIKSQQQQNVPLPVHKEIPELWKTVSASMGQSGTLVVWSKLDKCKWRTAGSIFDNSELLIGRMYRKFIHEGQVGLRMVEFNCDTPSDQSQCHERQAVANDPMYLMLGTSTPAPYNQEQLFELHGSPRKFQIDYNGQTHEVSVTCSIARSGPRQVGNAGATPYGRHAAKNIGVSLVRAGRELDLDQAWTIKYDPRERWWGIEVEFPPALDEVFGVTNNKQAANHFAELAVIDYKSIDDALLGESYHQLKQRLEDEGDSRAYLLDIGVYIHNTLQQFRGLIKQQGKGARPDRFAGPGSAEKIATEKTKERQEQGYAGSSDAGDQATLEERKIDVNAALVDIGIPAAQAEEIIKETFASGIKYIFANGELESGAFFTVKSKGGEIIIQLNTRHPAYPNLLEVMEEPDVDDIEVLRGRLDKCRTGLKLLLTAWARYEDEQPDGPARNRVQDTRADWGKIAREFQE